MPVNVVGFFCEDIREEKSGQVTLIGVLPDNINVGSRPAGTPESAKERIPKLGLYVRVLFEPDEKPGPMKLNLIIPGGEVVPLGEVGEDLIAKGQSDARANGLPKVGIVQSAVLQGFVLPDGGIITAVVQIGETQHICAMLNVIRPAS